jgi:NAD(P)-dependent dehydrogenase (short-subunit alcohol dehydrogenase family)
MNKVALITGASSGIGSATAKLFAQEGWHVIGVARRKMNKPEGINHYISGDVSKVSDVQRIFDEITNEEGRIDALINNAGIQICKPLVETTVDEWDAIMNTNVRSIFLCVKNAYPLMQEHGGSVVNVSSVHAIATSANIAAYATSKGAIVALTRAMAIELAHENIRVNAVLPGAVDTPMLRAGFKRGHLGMGDSQQQIEELSRRTVIGRVGMPNEIAQAILFLADESCSSFITGQMLVVDGGATAKLSTE